MKKQCQFCGNKNIRETTTEYMYKHDGKILMINDVPCEQCEYCGEKYFSGKVMEAIENEFKQIYYKGKKIKDKVTVPVEQFLELQVV